MAAETGQLLFSTLPASPARPTRWDCIIDAFPAARQGQVRVQLAMILQGVIQSAARPTTDGRPWRSRYGLDPRHQDSHPRGRTHQIDASIQACPRWACAMMDGGLTAQSRAGRIMKETALTYCLHLETMQRKLAGAR